MNNTLDLVEFHWKCPYTHCLFVVNKTSVRGIVNARTSHLRKHQNDEERKEERKR
jgi:hypothetical protein